MTVYTYCTKNPNLRCSSNVLSNLGVHRLESERSRWLPLFQYLIYRLTHAKSNNKACQSQKRCYYFEWTPLNFYKVSDDCCQDYYTSHTSYKHVFSKSNICLRYPSFSSAPYPAVFVGLHLICTYFDKTQSCRPRIDLGSRLEADVFTD